MRRCLSLSLLSLFALLPGLTPQATAQSTLHGRLRGPVNDANLVTLHGNIRPEVTADNDRGLTPDSTPLPALQLVMQRSPETQAAFESYLAGLTDPKSATYHHWLTMAEVGAMFGPSSDDINTVSQWLTAQGFTVNTVSPDGMVIEFGGTAGLVRTAFHTPIHNLRVNGVAHFANIDDPQIPAALAAAVRGIASLNDFMPHRQSKLRTGNARSLVQGNGGNGVEFLSAADLATIYNFNPLLSAGITGKGQTVVAIEDSDQYNPADWLVFRKVFGLTLKYPYGKLVQQNPTGTNTCLDPGVIVGTDAEAAIDVDWATAAAPNATILSAACKDTTQFGGFLALANLLQQTPTPKIVSISYGEAEASLGAAENAYIANLYATAVAEGVSVFVASGDEGAASADANAKTATHGIEVSGFASTPYNIAVGGTDFGNTYLRQSGYFSPTNGAYFKTAQSYIPEIPWDDSCAGGLISSYYGYPQFGTGSICNAAGELLSTGGGSGGPSGCAFGAPATRSIVSGTCIGYPKPVWQSVYGNPTDGVRDLPDVSLFASNGFWGAYYAVCISDTGSKNEDGDSGPCTADPTTWAGYGGTSVSSPIWAGIQALVNQSTGTNWGNSNTVLYSLGRNEYGSTGNSACNSTLGNAIGAGCVFNDVTLGDMVVNCSTNTRTGTLINCYNTGGTYGALSTSNSSFAPAYPATPGWDFPTGLGTTNATNLVSAWMNYARLTQ